MKPIKFKEQNCVYAENQSEYLPLPACKRPEHNGEVISCWRLSIRERIKILFSGKLWLSLWTFDGPLQPQLPSVDSPFEDINEGVDEGNEQYAVT